MGLPKRDGSENFESAFILEPQRIQKTRRIKGLRHAQLVAALDRVEEFERRLLAGGVKRADLAREEGLSRARVTQILSLASLTPAARAAIRQAGDAAVSQRRVRFISALPAAEQVAALHRAARSNSARRGRCQVSEVVS